MKKIFLLAFLTIISGKLSAQFQIGLSGGVFIPITEESGMFRPTTGMNFNLYLNTPINLMFGAHLSILNKMELDESWAISNLLYNNVEYNTAYQKYDPLLNFSVQYVIFNYNELFSFYFGLNFGQYTSSAHGEIKVTSGSNYQEFGFTGEENSDFGIAPKIGLMYEFIKNLKIHGELKYDIVFYEYKERILNLNAGLIYSFKGNK